jgi:hypothetical protein
VEFRDHAVEGAEPGVPDRLEPVDHLVEVGGEVRGLVGVGADREDLAAEVAIEFEDGRRGLKVGEAVAERRGVDLDAMAGGDDALKDGRDDVAGAFVGVDARRGRSA